MGDVVEATIGAMEDAAPGSLYNVGGGVEVSISSRRSCTRHLLALVRLARIIAIGATVEASKQRRYHRAGVQQVSDRAQRRRLRLLPPR